ncbi:MAG: SGNH/GDSL hydrolase family protein [Hyphomonas sp.]|nr:SGNH/GDSL hydrolase family protein [Hyphomonas sp.]
MRKLRCGGPVAALALATACMSAELAEAPSCAGWTGIWASSQQLVEPHNEVPVRPLENFTLRQTVRTYHAGDRVRLRFSNEFGEGPLVIGSASLALADAAGAPGVVDGSLQAVTFSGRRGITIPEGAAYYSDPLDFAVPEDADLSVSLHVVSAPARQSGHPGSRTTSFHVQGAATDVDEFGAASSLDHWYYLAGVDVFSSDVSASVGVIGDSITDGRGSTTNGNDRWTDFLAEALAPNGVSVLNFGLGGNRMLKDGLGPNVLARIDRDVLAQSNLRYLIVYEGVNDFGTHARGGGVTEASRIALIEDLKAAFTQVVERAHAHGIRVYGATIAPYGSSGIYPFNEEVERGRQDLNDWIRTSGTFDAVIDFDVVLRDPAAPMSLNPAFDVGDGLHPSVAGFEAMAAAISPDLFPAPAACD